MIKCSCGFENHSSCRFCIKCGTNLPGAGKPKSVPKHIANLGPPRSADRPQQSTEKKLEDYIKRLGHTNKKTRAGWSLEISLANDRKQKVHIFHDGKDRDGSELMTFLSICAPSNDKHALSLLKYNAKMRYCAFGVRKIQAKDYFVVSAGQSAATADFDEVKKIVDEVARCADQVEEQLTGGLDEN